MPKQLSIFFSIQVHDKAAHMFLAVLQRRKVHIFYFSRKQLRETIAVQRIYPPTKPSSLFKTVCGVADKQRERRQHDAKQHSIAFAVCS